MAGTVSFKVFMKEKNSTREEVRRFGIDSDVVSSFLYLREKIQDIFPCVRGRRFTINWKDADGDDIFISSDEELQIALQETASESIRKLYVVLESEGTFQTESDVSKNIEELHIGVTCDGCEQPVHGFRFKCIQCPNYDLCSNCQSQGMHGKHCMLRLTSPIQWKPHHGKRLVRQMNRFVRKASINKEDEPKCEWYKKGSKHHGRAQHCEAAESGASWIDTIASYLNEFANLPNECPVKKNRSTDEKQTPEPSTSELPKDKPTKDSEYPKLDAHVELLKMVGQNLSQFLDPLGIDVNFRVKSNEDTSSTDPVGPSTNNDNGEAGAPSTGTPPTNDKSTEADDRESTNKKVVPPPSDKETSVTEKPGENEDWTIIGTNPELPASSGAIAKKPIPQISPEFKNPQQIYPTLPEKENTFYHSDKKIQKAVETMMQMGFTNEGGWLTNLLETYNGDIVLALDALQR